MCFIIIVRLTLLLLLSDYYTPRVCTRNRPATYTSLYTKRFLFYRVLDTELSAAFIVFIVPGVMHVIDFLRPTAAVRMRLTAPREATNFHARCAASSLRVEGAKVKASLECIYYIIIFFWEPFKYYTFSEAAKRDTATNRVFSTCTQSRIDE